MPSRTHSEYAIYPRNKLIHLDNYKGASWEIDRITFDDWSMRFCNSAILSYHLFNEFHSRRTTLIQNFNTDTFSIVHFLTKSRFNIANIIYDEKPEIHSILKRKRRREKFKTEPEFPHSVPKFSIIVRMGIDHPDYHAPKDPTCNVCSLCLYPAASCKIHIARRQCHR